MGPCIVGKCTVITFCSCASFILSTAERMFAWPVYCRVAAAMAMRPPSRISKVPASAVVADAVPVRESVACKAGRKRFFQGSAVAMTTGHTPSSGRRRILGTRTSSPPSKESRSFDCGDAVLRVASMYCRVAAAMPVCASPTCRISNVTGHGEAGPLHRKCRRGPGPRRILRDGERSWSIFPGVAAVPSLVDSTTLL